MTIRTLLVACLLALGCAGIQGKTTEREFRKLWQEAEVLRTELDLPKAAIEKAETIYRKAESDGDTSQMMKAALFCMYLRNQLSPDSLYVDIPRLEAWVTDSTLSRADAAMLHSVLGSIYASASADIRDSRTVSLVRPEDLRDWSAGEFCERAFEHYIASTEHLEELQSLRGTSEEYAILYEGELSQYFDYSLMHVIGRRAVSGLWKLRSRLESRHRQTALDSIPMQGLLVAEQIPASASTYDCTVASLHLFYRMERVLSSRNALLMTRLERIKLLPSYIIAPQERMQALEELKKEYADCEAAGAVCIEMARLCGEQGEYVRQLEIVREGIRKYPKYGGINELHNMKQEILNPILRLYGKAEYGEGDSLSLHITHRNLDEVTVALSQMEAPTDSIYKYKGDTRWLKSHAKPYTRTTHALVRDTAYQTRNTVLKIACPTYGIYLLDIRAEGKEGDQATLLDIHPFHIEALPLPGGTVEYVVLDRQSGHPIPNATVYIALSQGKKGIYIHEKKQTDAEGKVRILPPLPATGYLVRVETDGVKSMLYTGGIPSASKARNDEPYETVKLLLDRQVYRPGQTVHVKGIDYRTTSPYNAETQNGKRYRLTLIDSQRQQVGQQEVVTNESGSFSTSFVLPQGGMNGTYRLQLTGGRQAETATFQVEEYKRPTYEVEFDTLKSAYAAGDTVILTGKAVAYTGVSLSSGKVTYRISRRWRAMPMKWGNMERDTDPTITGETVLDADGRFSVPVFLKPLEKLSAYRWWRCEYVLEATVTSSTGENRDGSTTLTLGSCPLNLSIEQTDDILLKGEPHPATFRVTNYSGYPMQTSVVCRLYAYTNPEMQEQEVLAQPPVWEGTMPSNSQRELEDWDRLPSGRYLMRAGTALLGSRDSVHTTREFTLCAENETKVPQGYTEWYYWNSKEFAPGEPAVLQFGTVCEKVHVMLDVFTQQKRIESRRFMLSDTVQTFTFDYQPKYNKGIQVKLFFVKGGNAYRYTDNITLKAPDKQLKMKWESFRNRLQPGTQEEWTLSILGPDSAAAQAEVLATMYDASLDAIHPKSSWKNWRIQFPSMGYLPWYWRSITRPVFLSANVDFPYTPKETSKFWRYVDVEKIYTDFSTIRMFIASSDNTFTGHLGSVEMANVESVAVNTPVATTATTQRKVSEEEDGESSSPEALPGGMQLRENFHETAFFHPHLRTDSTGRVKIAFTLPESLTRWRFQALAHTTSMEYGVMEEEVVARKDFMVQPNLPRFVRMGDETSVRTAIVNLCDKEVKGTVRLELIDPSTDRVILSRKEKFRVEAGETGTVSFSFTVKDNRVTLPVCRIVADGGKTSDGEQHYLPVLTNKVWLTESLPLTLTQAGTVTHSLDSLFNGQSPTAAHRRLTVEFTGNPAWAAIQALPSVDTPQTEDALEYARAWYVQQLAAYIVEANPQIKQVVEQWRHADADSETLWSNLQKNEELKTLVLSETPWVNEARNEEERHERLALLFDPVRTQMVNDNCLHKLKAMQLENGAWPWYKGMNESRYITTAIVELVARLRMLTGKEPDKRMVQMEEKAIRYLDEALVKEYHEMRETKNETPEVQGFLLKYLYALSLRPQKSHNGTEKAIDYFTGLLTKDIGSRNSSDKARIAIILHKQGREKEAQAFLASLMDYTAYTPQQGRFFEYGDISTQVSTIEALTILEGDSIRREEMKLWLLNQKRAQSWDIPIHTVEAVHALLLQGANLSSPKDETLLKLDNRPVEPEKSPLAGSGYFKRKYDLEDKKTPRKITLTRETEGLAWGAVYAQFLEEMEKTRSTYTGRDTTAYGQALAEPLSIERQLWVERIANGQSTWTPLTPESVLHVGDRIISRLTVRADRDMEFVQIKDSRAACTEPVEGTSGYTRANGLGFYRSVKDASTCYFLDRLPKGTHTIDTYLYIDRTGTYQMGIAHIQCAYAPEFTGHTGSVELRVTEGQSSNPSNQEK